MRPGISPSSAAAVKGKRFRTGPQISVQHDDYNEHSLAASDIYPTKKCARHKFEGLMWPRADGAYSIAVKTSPSHPHPPDSTLHPPCLLNLSLCVWRTKLRKIVNCRRRQCRPRAAFPFHPGANNQLPNEIWSSLNRRAHTHTRTQIHGSPDAISI